MKRNKKLHISALIVLICVIIIGQIVYGNIKGPGSSDDPIVTLSYVDKKIEQLKVYIDQKITGQQDGSALPSGSRTLEVVELKVGERLIAGAGTEIILRGGRAAAIDSAAGGLSDVTAAIDVRKDQFIQPNHLLIVPRNDGRGVRAVTDAIFMIRGSYTIHK